MQKDGGEIEPPHIMCLHPHPHLVNRLEEQDGTEKGLQPEESARSFFVLFISTSQYFFLSLVSLPPPLAVPFTLPTTAMAPQRVAEHRPTDCHTSTSPPPPIL